MYLYHAAIRLIRNPYLRLTPLLIISPLFLASCSKPTPDAGPDLSDPQSNVVATVNGVAITRDQMYDEMAQYVPAQLQNFPRNQMLGLPAGWVALQHLINNELTIQLAKEQSVEPTDAEVTSRYADVKMFKEAESVTAFEDLLKDQGLSVDQFKEENIKPDVAQFNLISKGITVSNQDLQANYNQNIADYTEPDCVHLQRIVVADEATAEKAYETASKSGSIEDVISLNIAAPLSGGVNSADIPKWLAVGQAVPVLLPVLTAAQNAKPGAILKPINVGNQWWIVKVVDKKPKCVLPFDLVKHIVDWNLISAKAGSLGNYLKVKAAMRDITQQSVIHVQPQYAPMVVQLKSPPMTQPQAQSAQPPVE